MVNKIKKKCPVCGCLDADILGAVIVNKESWNAYRCLSPTGRKHSFLVKRTGDKKEQALTEQYIKSSNLL